MISSTDVRKLLPEGLLTAQQTTGIARAFNNKTGRIVTTPSGHKVFGLYLMRLNTLIILSSLFLTEGRPHVDYH